MFVRLILSLLIVLAPLAAEADKLIQFPENQEFLPTSWTTDPILAKTEPLAEELRAPAQEIIERALEKYPEDILDDFLDGVFLVGSLRFYDVGYGGTYMANAKRIVLVYRSSFDPQGFEQRFHHEFSSILLKKNEDLFEEARWRKGNQPGYEYRAKGVIEEQSGDRSEATKVLAAEQKKTGGSGSSLLQLNASFMEEGFLTAYNRVSIEQDLNETAAHLFTNSDIWIYCERFPLIDHKVDVLIDFYRKLDPVFDRIYFRNLTRNRTQDDEAGAPTATP